MLYSALAIHSPLIDIGRLHNESVRQVDCNWVGRVL